MKPSYKDRLVEKYEKFQLEDHPERKEQLRLALLSMLTEIEFPDSDDYHIWGLTHYMSNGDRVVDVEKGLG